MNREALSSFFTKLNTQLFGQRPDSLIYALRACADGKYNGNQQKDGATNS
jgi:hypothetical protein